MVNHIELHRVYWTIGILLSVPLGSVILLELELALKRRASQYRSVVHWIRVLFLPSVMIWSTLVFVAGYEITDDLPKIVATLADISVIIIGLALVNAILFTNVLEDSWQARTPKLLVDIVRLVLVVIGIAVVASLVWGVDLGQVAAALGIGSIVIGLAIAEPLGNVFAGLMLLFERPFAVGDWIKIGSSTGQVVESNWRSVHLRTFVNELVVVPNSTLAKETFVNLSRPSKLHCENIELGFSYDDAPNKVRLMLQDLLETTPGILQDPAPKVLVLAYADFSITYKLIFYVEELIKLGSIRDELMTKVWYAARREGVTIPFPTATEIGYDPKEIEEKSKPPIETSLLKVPILFNLTESQRAQLPGSVEWRSFAKNEIIAGSGSPLSGIYLVIQGRVRATTLDFKANETPAFEVGPGDLFGESTASSNRFSEFKLVAMEDLDCVVIPYKKAMELVTNSPKFARELSRISDVRKNSKPGFHRLERE